LRVTRMPCAIRSACPWAVARRSSRGIDFRAGQKSIGATMPIPGSDDPSHPNPDVAPTISAHGHVVTGTGFLPEHNVAIPITCHGEDISDYLAYTTDRNGHLHAELPNSTTGTVHVTATDHRRDSGDPCGRLWSNTCTFVVGDI
jgi:hypothetical protein